MTLAQQLQRIPAFRGEAAFLSNFDPYKESEYFEFGGIRYPSNEHFYQAQKFTDPVLQRLIAAHTAKGLKKLVQNFRVRQSWEQNKDDVMRIGLEYKFSIPRYRDALLATGSANIVERNNWGDVYWGICDDRGENRLGKLIMGIRRDLIKNK